ncbi:Maltose/maltodextrin import ATP-binding protein MalK [subsurface metagenome]
MDQRIRTEVRIQIRRIHEELGNTTIYVTHDQEEAISLCDRILILHNTKLQQIGTVDEIYNKPVNKFVAFFVGQPGMNFIKCKVESLESISLQTSKGKNIFGFTGAVDPKYVGSEITMGIRPQQLGMIEHGGQKSIMSGQVKIVEFQGDNDVLTVELGDINKTQIKVVIPAGGKKFKQEETCWMDFQPECIHLFDETEKAIIERRS